MAGMFVIATSLWYAVDYVYAVVVNQQKSLGFDWEHVYYCLLYTSHMGVCRNVANRTAADKQIPKPVSYTHL